MEVYFTCDIQDDTKFVNVTKNVEGVLTISNYNPKFLNHLKETFTVTKDKGSLYRIRVTDEVIQLLEKYLFYSSVQAEETICLVTELYRSLRNSVTNKNTQNFVAENTKILEFTRSFIETFDKQSTCLKIILQFLINLISSNTDVTRKVYDQFLESFNKMIENEWCLYEISALLYNISLVIPPNISTINYVFKLDELCDGNEFVLFFLEKCIQSSTCWDLYNNFESKHKQIILETLRYQQIKKIQYSIPDSGLDTLINNFLASPDIFFKIHAETAKEEVRIVSLLLSIISSCSSVDQYVTKLQKNKGVLVTASALLINFHRLGKEDNNIFKPVQKLSASQGDETDNPVFGLKADLIQLIGNLCWKSAEMQNLAREAEIIPVVLDCCNIDANNPFIIQWCIFAIRNICENNIENQKFIAGLHKRGTVSSSVLEEFGITLHGDGDSELKIVPLDSLSNKTV